MRLKDPFKPNVYEKGYFGEGEYRSKLSCGTKHTKSYEVWRGIIRRCYSESHLIRNPTYRGCYVVDEWLNFQVFAKWFSMHYSDGYEVDKDLLSIGNKEYGPKFCIMLPKRINSFLISWCDLSDRSIPGIFFRESRRKDGTGRWLARGREFTAARETHIGSFATKLEAESASILFRKEQVGKAASYLRELGYSEDIISKLR